MARPIPNFWKDGDSEDPVANAHPPFYPNMNGRETAILNYAEEAAAAVAWASGRAYFAGKVVTNGGHTYAAIDAHTSGGSFSADSTHWTLLPVTKADVGLSNVDNTSDATKPISTAQAAALATKAPLSSDVADTGKAIDAHTGAPLSLSAQSGGATVIDLGGNLGAAKMIATAGANVVARNAILDQASCTVTLTGLPAGEYRSVRIIGVKGAAGNEALFIDDGSGAVQVSTPTGVGAEFEIIVDWDGTDSNPYPAGGGGGTEPPFAISDTTGLQAALDSKPTATLDTDGTLAGNSDVKVASQKATKAYVDAQIGGGGSSLSLAAVYGLKTWNWDPVNNNSTINLGNQALMTTLLVLPADETIANLISFIQTAGASLTDGRAGLWRLDGTLIAQSANRSAAWNAAPGYSPDVTPLVAEAGQSLDLAAGLYIGGLLPLGTTSPIWSCLDNTKEITNMGLSAPALRSAFLFPVTDLAAVDLAGLTSNNKTPWMGLS
jgi:hypothetical protein